MSTKKNPANKAAAAKGPTPLLKMYFDKFPNKPVPAFFETTKRCFYADFGFEQYESPSVAGLEQKIKAAIQKGATPEAVWTPVIAIEFYLDHSFQGVGLYRKTGQWELAVDRSYVTVKNGKVFEADWEIPANKRMAEAGELSNWEKLKGLTLPLRSNDETYDHKMLVAYDEQIFIRLQQMQKAINGIFDDLALSLRVRKLPTWWPQTKKPAAKKAAAAPKKPAAKKSGTHSPMLNSTKELCICEPKRRTAQIGTNPYCKFPHAGSKQAELPLDSDHSESAKSAAKKALPRRKTNGDHSAREHLVVKYQGKQLTLGHGPLGNYLVEALRKTYPTIHSAYCLKDNSVQISLQGVAEPLTITSQAFETAINLQPNTPSLRRRLGHGGAAVNTPGPEFKIAALNGAIAKLHELVDGLQPEDPPLVIPVLILMAAGFPESASADMHSPDEIIVRVPKKAPQFMSLFAFEERIRERIPAEPEKELVGA